MRNQESAVCPKERLCWIVILGSGLFFLSLCYVRRLLSFSHIGFAGALSHFIMYAGPAYMVLMLAAMYLLKKKYNTPNKTLLRDKKIAILLWTLLFLGNVMMFL